VANTYSATSYLNYDALGRALQSSQATAAQAYSFSYGYNLMGSLTSETYPSGRVITTEYDGAERASSVAGDLASLKKNYATQVSYVPHGGIRALPMGNNVWQVYSYNSRMQVQRIEDAVNNDPSQVLFDQHFEWGTSDNNGNLQSVVTNHGGPGYPQFLTFKEYYGYDPLNRVLGSYGKDINENLLWGQNFSYDRYGNRWITGTGGLPGSGLTPTTNVYNAANQMGATSYDGAGNQTQFGANALVYDAENHVVQATEAPSAGGQQTQYVYDGDGRRVMKIATAPQQRLFEERHGAERNPSRLRSAGGVPDAFILRRRHPGAFGAQ
jgi:YD repeat-containing protein